MSLLKPNPAAVNAIRQILGEGEERMLEATAKRLARGITEPGWAERKLAEVQDLQAEIRRQFQDTYQGVAVHLEEAIKDGLAGGPNIGANIKATEALVDETLLNVRSTEVRILRGHQDLYRQVVARAGAVQTTGSTTVRQAAQAVMGQLSEQGVTAFVDKRGRSWKLGTYSEMAVRTATARAQVGARLNEYVEDGHKLVIVSNSPNECPRCRKWEGRVLAIDAGNLTSTDLYEADGTVKEAQSEGLFHPNCTHDLRPYVPGLTKRDPEVGFPTSEDAARLRKKGAAARQRKEAARRREAGEAPFGESPELQATRAKARAAEAESAKLQAKIAAEAKQKAEQEAKAVKKKAANPKVSKGDKPGHPFRGNQRTKRLPAGTPLIHMTHAGNVDSIRSTGMRANPAGESGPGVYLTHNKPYQSGSDRVRMDFETTKPLKMLDRSTPEGEAEYRRLAGPRRQAEGYDGVLYQGVDGTAPEVVVYDPKNIRERKR